MAVKKPSNIIDFGQKKTEKKLQKKLQVLVDSFTQNFECNFDKAQACIIETLDGKFHETFLQSFDEKGVFCFRTKGHTEFFDYRFVRNIF